MSREAEALQLLREMLDNHDMEPTIGSVQALRVSTELWERARVLLSHEQVEKEKTGNWIWQTTKRFSDAFWSTVTHKAVKDVGRSTYLLQAIGPVIRECEEGFLVEIDLVVKDLAIRLRAKPQADLEKAKEEAIRLYEEFQQILNNRKAP